MSLPLHMRADDSAAADPARRRLLHKPRPFRLPSVSPRRPRTSAPLPSPDTPADDIHIDDAHSSLPADDMDVFRWAILYENQRGITLFSTPFYSSHSLFLSDPQPFSIPDAHSRHLPDLSLANYPLPDGTWRWVSPAWMIDMRSELGEVQPDGFEYNCLFRDKHWHGNPTTGTWVRRRRWIRLMMRPSHAHFRPTVPVSPSLSPSPASTPSLAHQWDGGEQDWHHLRRLLNNLGRDGRKLELWRMWLTPYIQTPSDIKGKRKLSNTPLETRLSDVLPDGNPPPLEHLATIFGNHGEAILRSFVFPDSRAQFVHLLRQAGLAEDLERCLGRAFSAADVDFWSYADNLEGI